MYSYMPKRDRVSIKSALGSAWGFTAVAGVGGIFLTPMTVQAELGPIFPTVSAMLILAASLAAVFGVVYNKYQIEWVAAWFALAGQVSYVITVWTFVFTGSETRLQQAASLTSLCAFYAYRICMCSAHARKQRKIHELVQSGEMRLPDAIDGR